MLVLTRKVKAAIKPVPFLYKILQSSAALLRRARNSFHKRKLERFRHYCSYLPTIVPEPMFVKVGANDGVTGDPCSDILLAEKRWKGLLIEPVPYCFDRLKENFYDTQRFSLQQVAIGKPNEEATFYYVDSKAYENIPDLPYWFDQLGSFDKSHIIKHLNGILTPFILECEVKVRLLSDVLRENGIRDVHLLHIDTEGHDFEVLKTLDFTTHAPTAIFIEHKHLPKSQKTEMRHLLRTQGYSVHNCGSDYFALDKKANKRLQRLALERPAPN